MKQKKSHNNKGFSLVELIIVIAIMAILIGVMAPQLIRYLEKANKSSDAQLADTVRTAVTVAMMDPDVIGAADNSIPAADTVIQLSDINAVKDEFGNAVKETLGLAATGSLADIENKLKSKDAKEIHFQIVGSNAVEVYVTKENETDPEANALIKVPQE